VKDAAYVTWRAMIFYLATSQISFAPLYSNDRWRGRSATEIKHGINSTPSAKSMYRLADKLGLEDLCKLSLSHIQSQLSIDNVIQEVFTPFTSRYKTIRTVELAFIFDHWEELKNSQQLHEVLDNIIRGDLLHCKDVLAAILAH